VTSIPPDPGGRGERVLLLFVESETTKVLSRVAEALRRAGFDVYVAAAGAGTAVELDYQQAVYVPVALVGDLVTHRSDADLKPAAQMSDLKDMKALVFPGVPLPERSSDVVRLRPDTVGDLISQLRDLLRQSFTE
jgi:hypothetical protein